MIKHVPVLLVAIPLLAAFMIPMIGMVNRTARTVVGVIALVMILAASYYIAGDILVHGRILYY
ncbi:MAG: NADH:ubiquinone oxidoreductase, partial [Spirochaetes bacterium]|nr:NADH:ubiquinone oxidoreductase [Spirochaetota bacterium]